jgi:hypothetical protein
MLPPLLQGEGHLSKLLPISSPSRVPQREREPALSSSGR